MQIEEITARLEGVKASGGGYSAKCPAHDDKRASLSISTGESGKILLYCHAGCSVGEIVGAMGLKESDLFPDAPYNRSEGPRKARREVVARYDYTDENGRFLCRKTRFSDKSFAWSHKKNGKWARGRGGDPALYNLAGIQGAGRVFVVEGEKDVETLKAAGVTAASGPDGAGPDKWKPTYTEALAGREVVIIPDNDQTGRAYAREVAAALHGRAKSVKLLDLCRIWPELPEHGDTTDAVELHGTNAIPSILQAADVIEAWNPEGTPEAIPDFFDGRRFLHNVMGDYLIQKLHACKINGAVHIYENGVYKQGEEALHGHMLRLVPSLTAAKRKEVYQYIKVSPNTPEKEIAAPELIPFATRIYNLTAGTFLDYGPEHVFLNRFPYDYKPDAPAVPLVDDTIDAIACGDMEVKQLLLEAIGNCFFLLNSYRGAVMLYGSGNNGKSTLLNMITRLLGKDNASHLSLQDLAERFRLIEIYGKAANIGDDIPGAYIPDSSHFKKAVTGECLTAEKKGQDPISFRPFAKMFFAMNALPAVSDKSKGFFSRVLLIPLDQDFSQIPTRNPGLKDRRWTQTEMEYLTRLAIEGLKRLIAQGDFTRPKAVQEAVEEYERENNPVKEFLEEYAEDGETLEDKPTALIYDSFVAWCRRSGHKNLMSRNRFTAAVRKETGLYTRDMRSHHAEGKVVKCYSSVA